MGAVSMGAVVNATQSVGVLGRGLAKACIPSGVTVTQLIDVFVLYLEDRPSFRHYNAASSVWASMEAAFLCD